MFTAANSLSDHHPGAAGPFVSWQIAVQVSNGGNSLLNDTYPRADYGQDIG